MGDDLSFLDEFGKGFEPVVGQQFPDLGAIPDGDYDWTIMAANIKRTPNSGDTVVELEVKCEALNRLGNKAYFLSSQENLNRMGGDFATLGINVAAWKGGKISELVPMAVKALKGRRFKGTKKTNPNKTKPDKPYHNLYINSALPTDETVAALPDAAPAGSASSAVPF